jgi:hypothetical protein
MITFKQFIAEIDHDDEVYSKEASDYVMGFGVDDSWEPLLTLDGNQVLWKQVFKEYRVVMVDKASGKPMMRLELRTKTVKVPGGTLTGVITDSLSSKKEFRGQGLALKIYDALLKHGQVLFSSNSQTTGSRKLWEQLVQKHLDHTFVLAEEAAARWYIKQFADDELSAMNVLLTGPYKAMNDEAYASSETRWVIVPGNVENLKNAAISLSPIREEKQTITLYRGMSQENFERLKRTKQYSPEPRNPHNDATTDLETARYYASTKVHDDEGVVIKFEAPIDAVKQDPVTGDDYKIIRSFPLGSFTLVEAKFVPEWEKPCWIVAINQTLGTPEAKIKALAKKAGWDGKSFGAPVHTAIQVAWDVIGKMPDLSQTKAAKGMTPKEYSSKTNLTGMVFTSKHVMPMVNGRVSNFNGHGDEPIIAVATYEKP